MTITVADILELPVMERARVVAGSCGLSHPVEGISIMEDCDSGRWMLRNNLLLTNGHAIIAHMDDLQGLMDTFMGAHVACITVKRGRNMEKVPDDLVEFANRVCLPVISLPSDATSAALISAISYELFRNEAHNLEYSYEIDMLRDLVLENEDWNILRNRLATLGWSPRKVMGAVVLKRCGYCKLETTHPDFYGRAGFPYAFPLYGKEVLFADLDGEEHPADKLEELARGLDAALLGCCRCRNWRIGVGSPAANLGQLSTSYKEAVAALCLGIADNAKSRVIPLFNTGIFSVLLHPRAVMGTEAVVKRYVRFLKRHDEQNGTELYRTMVVYGQEGKNVRRTAERMFVHENTVRYRLKAMRALLSQRLMEENVDLNIDVICTLARWFDAMEREASAPKRDAEPPCPAARPQAPQAPARPGEDAPQAPGAPSGPAGAGPQGR